MRSSSSSGWHCIDGGELAACYVTLAGVCDSLIKRSGCGGEPKNYDRRVLMTGVASSRERQKFSLVSEESSKQAVYL